MLLDLLETDTDARSANQPPPPPQSSSSLRRNDSANKRTLDPWLARFRIRVEHLNNRWNNVRLRVLTLRSRLESSSLCISNTTTPAPPPMATTPSASLYSVNGGGSVADDPINTMATFNSVVSERASQLSLSLRELIEWIIKRQTEFEQKQQRQQQIQSQQLSQNVPLDIANVVQQKSALVQLRSQLMEKRPVIDSSLLACHHFLRRVSVKRAQDVQYAKLASKMPTSSSMSSSIASYTGGVDDPQRRQFILAQKRCELNEIEMSVSREMNKLLELWHSIQAMVEMRLHRLDEAHLVSVDSGDYSHTSCVNTRLSHLGVGTKNSLPYISVLRHNLEHHFDSPCFACNYSSKRVCPSKGA